MIRIGVDTRSAVATVNNAGKVFDRDRFLRLVGAAMRHWINQNFEQEGKEVKWKSLSPNTIASRRKKSMKPLQDTGRLKMSIKPAYSGNEVFVGTEDERAKWHHFGTPPYVIEPRSKDHLRFTVAGGQVVFAKRVRHPGLDSRPIFPSDTEAERVAVTELDAYVDRMIGVS